MKWHHLLQLRLARRFFEAEMASAAVEFSLILPFLLLLFFGAVELTDGVTAKRKVTLVADTVSDLIARVKDVDATYADNAFTAASAVITPFDESKLSSVVSNVVVDANGAATVAWSLAKNTSPRVKGSTFPLAAALKVPNSALVVTEVAFDYQPITGYAYGTLTMSETSYAQPRVAGSETGVTCSAPGC